MRIKDFLLLYSTITIINAAQTIDRHCLDCMCQASSSCNLKLRCHNAADGAYYCGPYQISWAYWADGGKPGSAGFSNDFEKCLVDRSCAEKTIAGYMSKWASDCNGDGQIGCLDFAAIHKTGPTAQCNQSWLKNSKYWTDFNRCYASASPSTTGSSSSGFTDVPSNTPNHDEVYRVESVKPQYSGSYAISSSDPKPISGTVPEVTLSASSSSSPISPISSSYPSSTSGSSHYSSSSSYSNYTEITEETSGNLNSNYNSVSNALPGASVYETTINANLPRTRVVEEVSYEQPSVIRNSNPPAPVPAPIRVDVRANPRTTSNYAYEQPSHPLPAPASVPGAAPPPIASVSSYSSPAVPSIVSENCLQCLCQASSKCQLNKGCDGAYCGPYLLSWAYWTDGGKPGSQFGLDYPTCSQNQSCAEQAVNGYMTKWTRDCNGDGVVDCTDYALIHKLGPHGCHRFEALKSTEYWNRFESCNSLSTDDTRTHSVQPIVEEVQPEIVRYQPEVVRHQPEIVRRQPEAVSPSSEYGSTSYQPAVEPAARRNDFHEQPLNVPRPQPNAFFTPRQPVNSPSSGSTSNIRISFNNREIVNTALQDTPIIHPPQPQSQPQPVRSFNSFNNRFTAPATNSFNPPPREYPPRASSAFSTAVVPETPRASDYTSNPRDDGANIHEVPANNDNTGFDDDSVSGRSVDGNSAESIIQPNSNFNPFEPLKNQTEDDIISQECLNCMCHAASRCDNNIGCSSDSRGKFVCGVYQVDWQYWTDAGKPGNRADLSNLENFQMCLNDRSCADQTIRGYMKMHQMDCNNDGKIDCHDFAALHVVGPQNCRAKWYLESKYHSDFNECYSF